MTDYMEYLNLPEKITIAIVGLFLIMQIVGEFCELGGKTVPEILKIRKFFKRKRQERETIASIPETLKEFNTFLESVNQHYSEDNIAQRNDWMKHVNDGLDDLSGYDGLFPFCHTCPSRRVLPRRLNFPLYSALFQSP